VQADGFSLKLPGTWYACVPDGSEELMNPTPKRWSITVPVLLVLFFGGGFAGELLASVLTSDSGLARLIGSLALPTTMILGFVSWLGTASVIALKRGVARDDKRVEMPREEYAWGRTAIPPGSIAFVVASIVPSLAVGALIGFISTQYGIVRSSISYVGMGAAYGVLCWRAAANGYLPFPIE
jgi:hypothetical protein